jgi:AcrR family transcriptional regulator
MQRRERRSALKRRTITRAAIQLALDKGLDSVTVENISEAADIAPRTFFNYFSTKDDALTMQPTWSAGALRELLASRPADEPIIRSVRELAKEIAESYGPARDEAELWRELWRRYPALLTRAQPKGEEEVFRILILAVAERMKVDPLQDIYPSVMITTAFSIIQWAVRFSWVLDNGKSVDELIDDAFALLERGL